MAEQEAESAAAATEWAELRDALMRLKPWEDWERGHLGSSARVLYWGHIRVSFAKNAEQRLNA